MDPTPGVSFRPSAAPATRRSRSASVPSILSLALVAAAVAWSIGTSRARSPGAGHEALLASVDAEDLASTTAGCRDALLREEARRARSRGFANVAIPVRLPPDRATASAADPPHLPPEAIARRLAEARPTIAAEGLRAIPLVELPAGEDCGSRRVRAFVSRWRDAIRESDDGAGLDGNASGAVRRRHTRAARGADPSASPVLAAHVLCRAHGSPNAVFDGGSGEGLPEAIVEETGLPKIVNGNFRRGWDGWRTRGRVALGPPDEPVAEACYPLVARLEQGGSIAQTIVGGLHDLVRDVPAERPGEEPPTPAGAEVVLDLVPAAAARRVSVDVGRERHELEVAPGVARARVALASPPEDGDELSVEVPPESAVPVALTGVGLRRADEGSGPIGGRTRLDLAPWQVLAVAKTPPEGPSGRASIDLSKAADLGVVHFAPDEMNAWKMYVYFGREDAPAALDRSPGWLRRTLPWVTHLRFPAALGGNFCDRAPKPCRTLDRTSAEPSEVDCFDAPSARAAAHEILREDAAGRRLDFATWSRTIDDVLGSGMLPHLNLSSAPCAFTDGFEFNGYRWNERPVVRHAEWRSYVRETARELARRPEARDFRFSIVNEPNCRWVLGERLPSGRHRISLLHVGYAGDADQYATQFAETVAEILSVLPDAWVQLGNFTIGGGSPLEDNLPEFLAAVDAAMGREGVDPARLRALSLSLYETPQHGLDEIPSYKLGRLARWRGEGSSFRDLPIKLDEVGVIELVARPFRERTGVDVQTTRWTAAWHAELLGLAISRGFVSQAPWLTQMFADRDLRQPRPFYWTYALAALALGDVVPDGPLADPGVLRPIEQGARVPRRLRSVSLSAEDPDGIGHVVLEDPGDGALWLLAWRHDPVPAVDREADGRRRLALDVKLPAGYEATVATVLSLDGTRLGAPWGFAPFATAPARASDVEVRGGTLSLDLPAESVHLVRLPRRPA